MENYFILRGEQFEGEDTAGKLKQLSTNLKLKSLGGATRVCTTVQLGFWFS